MSKSSQAGSSPYSEYISKAEDIADQILRNSKHVLPHVARFCLISTFFEDGFRMWFQWDEQRDYMDQTWHCGTVVGTMFVLFNLVAQLAGCVMVLSRQKVEIAVGMLSSVIVVQVSVASVVYTFFFIYFSPSNSSIRLQKITQQRVISMYGESVFIIAILNTCFLFKSLQYRVTSTRRGN